MLGRRDGGREKDGRRGAAVGRSAGGGRALARAACGRAGGGGGGAGAQAASGLLQALLSARPLHLAHRPSGWQCPAAAARARRLRRRCWPPRPPWLGWVGRPRASAQAGPRLGAGESGAAACGGAHGCLLRTCVIRGPWQRCGEMPARLQSCWTCGGHAADHGCWPPPRQLGARPFGVQGLDHPSVTTTSKAETSPLPAHGQKHPTDA